MEENKWVLKTRKIGFIESVFCSWVEELRENISLVMGISGKKVYVGRH